MTTLTSKSRYWPLTLGSLAIFGLILFLIALLWRGGVFILGFFFVVLAVSVLMRKIIREIDFDGGRLEITYMQWGFRQTASLDVADVLVDVVDNNMNPNRPYDYLTITDLNHRLLYQVRTGDGYNIDDLKAFAGAIKL